MNRKLEKLYWLQRNGNYDVNKLPKCDRCNNKLCSFRYIKESDEVICSECWSEDKKDINEVKNEL